MGFLFREVAALFYCGTPLALHINNMQNKRYLKCVYAGTETVVSTQVWCVKNDGYS